MRAILVAVLLLAVATVAVAASYEDGLVAFYRGNYAEAVRLWRPSAEQGDATAQYFLGQSYYDGLGVSQDYGKAAVWLRKAAEQDDAIAQWTLGLLYEDGHGVRQSYVQAYMWFDLATTKSPLLDVAVDAHARVAALMTPAQIAEAQRLAREWRPKPWRKQAE